MAKFVDMTGKTFGNITVITRITNDSKHEGARWLCRCEKCNKLIATRTDKLNTSKYTECSHGDCLDIPNVGRINMAINKDYYKVELSDGAEVVMHISKIIENCKYE